MDAPHAADWLAVPASRLDRVLKPYGPSTTLVASARSRVDGDGVLHLEANTRFGTAAHRPGLITLDAVEGNILYNQMLYLLLGETVVRGLHPLLQHWTWDDFLSRQLPNVLILQFGFAAVDLERNGLRASIRFTEFVRKHSMTLLQTDATFADDGGRSGNASVLVGLVDQPPVLPAPDPR